VLSLSSHYIVLDSTHPCRPIWGTTSLRNPGQSKGYHLGAADLAMHCLPLKITNRYFIWRAWVHQYRGRYRDLVYRGGPLVHRRSVHGRPAVGVACLESMNWVRVTGARHFYLRHAPDRVIWLATLFHCRPRRDHNPSPGVGLLNEVNVRQRTGGNRHGLNTSVVLLEKHNLVHTINRSLDQESNPRPLAYGNTASIATCDSRVRLPV
jgi:hypothetical protein